MIYIMRQCRGFASAARSLVRPIIPKILKI